MIHQHIYATLRPGRSDAAFQDYGLNVHAVRFAAKIPQIARCSIPACAMQHQSCPGLARLRRTLAVPRRRTDRRAPDVGIPTGCKAGRAKLGCDLALARDGLSGVGEARFDEVAHYGFASVGFASVGAAEAAFASAGSAMMLPKAPGSTIYPRQLFRC